MLKPVTIFSPKLYGKQLKDLGFKLRPAWFQIDTCSTYRTTTHLLFLFCINAYVYNFAFYSSCVLCYSLTVLPTRKLNPWKLNYFLFISIPSTSGLSEHYLTHNKHWIKVYRIRLNCITIKLNWIMYLPQISEFCVSDDVLGSGCHFPHAGWHVASAILATIPVPSSSWMSSHDETKEHNH